MNSIEREFVHNTYQKIANRFDITRGYLWKSVKDFLDSIESNSILLEVGSGNGRNLSRRTDCFSIAFDLCSNFAMITNNKGIESSIGNNLSLPFRDNTMDNLLSIAVIHHFTTEKRRLRAIKEFLSSLMQASKKNRLSVKYLPFITSSKLVVTSFGAISDKKPSFPRFIPNKGTSLDP